MPPTRGGGSVEANAKVCTGQHKRVVRCLQPGGEEGHMLQTKLLDLLQVVLLLRALASYHAYHVWKICSFLCNPLLIHDKSREKDAKVLILSPRGRGDQESWGGGGAGERQKERKTGGKALEEVTA